MRCLRCNHHIWVRESVRAQMGPVCREKKNLKVYSETAETIKANLRMKGVFPTDWAKEIRL